ncbi:hypothetical protein ACH9DO_14900 [Kocuria sp. M1N1S27]|uniref:hypothetical protein n=1 Tax=Kocuria kalidii TaxID=3376283 RepID=UPI00379788C7
MSTTNTQDAAIEAAARVYYGIQNLTFPSDPEMQAQSRERWDSGSVEPHIREISRDAVRPIVLAALVAATNEEVTNRV